MQDKLLLQDLSTRDQRVLMRVDFNVPLSADGKVTDNTRIRSALPSIQSVLDNGGTLILMSHLGRPKGERKPEFSLAPCAKELEKLLKRPVQMAPDCVGPEVEQLVKDLKPGQVLLLENLRFHAAEEKPEKDPSFAQKLAKLADVYVNDAFGAAHRSHSSVSEITQYFPGKAAAGYLMANEMRYLGELAHNTPSPFVAIIGGAKVSSKLSVLQALLQRADALVIGGGMAFTFLKAQGYEIGDSLLEPDLIETAADLLKLAEKENKTVLLPKDLVAADAFKEDAHCLTVDVQDGIPKGYQGLDIGPKTTQAIAALLQDAKTIFWNGPLGVFEIPTFAKGTQAVAKLLAKSPATTVVGGGDSVAAVNQAGVADQIDHISTGGGASLEFLEKGQLPGIEALSEHHTQPA